VNGDGTTQPDGDEAVARQPVDGEEPGTPGEPAAVPVGERPEGEAYVPMSEWIEDFDRRA
jgi:hypothetical protein